MTPEQLQRMKELFNAAIDLPPEQRSSHLDEHCGDDPALREHVRQLLTHHERMTSPHFMPEAADYAGRADVSVAERLVGTEIGGYTVTEVIEQGGMGVVYRAEQKRPERPVALKMIHPGVLSRPALSRFRHEVQVLGRLQHPGIAHIYEAGMFETDNGSQPFFAMEYIEGENLLQYAETQRLSVRQRLLLLIKICHAVHHAHQKGIVHRDLKPENILVTTDGDPKILDFGVARATDSDIQSATIQTYAGELLGTIPYMSPEQVKCDPDDIDTRSDVYSLAVVGYELLVDSLPYEISERNLYEATRVICDHEPTPLSARKRSLRGDVEIIFNTALSKAKDDRYQSAYEFAADVQRYLDGEPILARPPTRWQRMTRWVGRHPVVTTTAASIAIAVTVFLSTLAAIQYLSHRPYNIELSHDGREARLISTAGNVLHRWTAAVEGIQAATMVRDVPEQFGGGSLVLVSYNSNQDNPHISSLCAYDADQPEKLLWADQLKEDDIPPALIERGLAPNSFDPRKIRLLDIFPSNPGPELVVSFSHWLYSQNAIRIYGLDGSVLYQVWHDGQAHDFYWMSEPELLVVTGANGLVYWEEREFGSPDEIREVADHQHPQIIFAFRPQLHDRSTNWICPDREGDNIIAPTWYQCVMPPTARNYVNWWRLSAPGDDLPQESHVILDALADTQKTTTVNFVLDDNGSELRDRRVVSDAYRRAMAEGELPDADIFHLADLPPVRTGVQLPYQSPHWWLPTNRTRPDDEEDE